MRYLITIALICCVCCSTAIPSTYRKLNDVNRYWAEQKDVKQNLLPAYSSKPEREWIRLHLSLVEQTLRNRPVTHLSLSQQQLRKEALDHLHQYWLAGNFPLNEQHSYRTPIFIDNHDNFCAVGYLVKATGHEPVSRMIASRTNLAYVMDMRYPELDRWARSYGFSKEELAWIQPAYPPAHYTDPVGGGTDGDVKELSKSQDGEKLYVGGSFTTVDNNINASNIAYVTKDNGVYNWHKMGNGTNGPVMAVAELNGKIFAGGSFTMAGTETVNNIAYWENNSWHSAGCLYGTVSDLVVFNGELYAAGDFDVCAGSSEVNFAKWNGTTWAYQVPPVEGKVNTLEAVGDRLLLGGDMIYQGNKINAIAWKPGVGFQPFISNVTHPINDFEPFKGTLYASCTVPAESSNTITLLKLENNQWLPVYEGSDPFIPFHDKLSLNTLLVEGETMLAGGSFIGLDMMSMATNCKDVTPMPYAPGTKNFYTDDEIHKMIWFKNDLIAGGSFRNGMTPVAGTPIPVGGIARRTSQITSIPEPGKNPFRIYPNPMAVNGRLTIENNSSATLLKISDITGRTIFKAPLQAGSKVQQVQLPNMVPALYMAELHDTKGMRYTQKLLLQ